MAKQTGDIEVKIKAIEEQLGGLEAEHARIAGGLEEELRENYERLFITKDGDAIVALSHDVCMGCHMKVTPTTSAKCRAGKEIVHCEQCGRLLYRGD